MKGFILSFIIFFATQNIFSQLKGKIYNIENRVLSSELIFDIKTVLKDFMQTEGGGKNEKFILIDLVDKSEENELYLVSSRYVFEIMFKRPDCYFIFNNSIVYLYTKNYIYANEPKWLTKVFTETHQILNAPNFKICWSNDSVIGVIKNTGDLNKITPIYHYDPISFKYVIKNGNIISKKAVDKLYYPNNRTPKGIPIIRVRQCLQSEYFLQQ